MSRFAGAFGFGGGDDSSSEEEKSSAGGDAAPDVGPAATAKVSKYFMDSDGEDAEERHFKLGRDKKWEALEKVLEACTSVANVKDFSKMDDNMPKLTAEIEKNSSALFAEQGDKLPNRVLKVLLLYEDTINELTNAAKKKLGKITAQAHTKLKQKFKKYLQETGEGDMLYETQLNAYREDPQDSAEEGSEAEEDDDEEEEKKEEEEEEDEEEDDYDDEDDADAKAGVTGAAAEAKKEGGDDAEEEDEYYDEEADYGDEDEEEEKEDEIALDATGINPKLKQKYAFLWKSREEMTASERRWKWVKKEALPEDLQKLMDQLMGKKQKAKAEDNEDGTAVQATGPAKAEDQELFESQIKRDYLSMDFTLYTTCQEILEALKEERLKAKYSAEFHTQVLSKIFTEMPCQEVHEIKMKVEVIIYLVGTIFQTAKSTNFLDRDQWVTVYDRVRELLRLSQTPAFMKALKEAHAAPTVTEDAVNEDD